VTARGGRAAALLAALLGCGGADQPPGTIEGPARAALAVEGAGAARAAAAAALAQRAGAAAPATQILFGDLHVHTTYSVDAFLYALPIFSGEGAHPPADACDFARHCAALDFFSINDHAEGLTPERWEATRRSIEECNARAGDPASPDLVAFLGWEWTQVGRIPETHYGHKNVILRGGAGEPVPTRPITALGEEDVGGAPPDWLLETAERLLPGPYGDFLWWIRRLAALESCPRGVPVRELPADCRESAPTPAELFSRLDEWGAAALVIPHGLVWGIHAPPGSRLDPQLAPGQHDPARQRLLEIFSGHGSGEEYQRALDPEPAQAVCPEPSAGLLPCCWQAGELVRARCGALSAAECEVRVAEARRLALEAGVVPHRVVPDAEPAEWLDCDQCRDCFKPAFSPRAGLSAQAVLARSLPGADGAAARWRLGFVASSDDHHARAGTGYKQAHRLGMTDARGLRADARAVSRWITRPEDPARAQPARHEPKSFRALFDSERTASFLYPGGLVAVHATGRDRASLWQALLRREVYGTSGPRILLWFELLNAPGGPAPMGSEVSLPEPPRFEARAAGALEELPGCPGASRAALSPERLARLCLGECHHPGERRQPIVAIEVVRVRAQLAPGEEVAPLVEDPWLRFECSPDPEGCAVRFEDPELPGSGRSAAYYVRALQAATPAVNGANLRTEFDAGGRAVRVSPCYGDERTPADDDCLAPVEERAWSSPIWVDPAGG
jgi:hypothetical protein